MDDRSTGQVTQSAAEIYEAMQRGVIQGATGLPMWWLAPQGIHEVSKVVIEPHIGSVSWRQTGG